MGVRSAVHAQHVFEKAQDKDNIHRGGKLDGNAISIKQATGMTRMRSVGSENVVDRKRPSVDMQSVGIKGEV